MTVKVTKRNGIKENFNLSKIQRVLKWASKGLKNVSISDITVDCLKQIYNEISTSTLHSIITKVAADFISDKQSNYQYIAARLAIFNIRKNVYNQFDPIHIYDHVKKLVLLKKYDDHLLQDYNQNDFNYVQKFINHNRDMKFTYAAIQQMTGKYLIKDRVTDKIYETPQMLYMLISLCLFSKQPANNRMKYIIDFYNAISTFKISLPTPIMAGVRTPTKQFSSCVLIDTDDTLNSINATASCIVKYISKRAGIGINGGKIRAAGSSIRNGEAIHTGCIPFYKHFQTAVKSCSQGGVRGGAATLFYPIWHLEIESLFVLKNNRGVDENRIRHLDYGVQINKIMYQRLIEKNHITLFSPNDVPDLYNSFFSDQEKFNKLYLQAENNINIRKKTLPAVEIFSLLMQERSQTGRIYIQNIDHSNDHSAFDSKLAPIKQSNLCMEINLPTKYLDNIFDKTGEISLCTLSAINLGEIQNLNELEYLSELIVTALDNLLDYQDYPIISAEKSAKNRRSLGVGVINFAYYLAKNNVKYSNGSANDITHKIFEAFQYFLLKASNKLAKSRSACKWFNQTKYYKGLLPIDHYKKDVDCFTNKTLYLDWEKLRNNIKTYGLRNSTLSAIMPSETSSQISNAVSGIEPARGLMSIKQSKDGVFKQVVPEVDLYRNKYELLWNIPNNKGYLKLCAIMQKFIDQAISVNTNYDPMKYLNNKVPMRIMIEDLLIAYKYGIKSLYYHNTRDNANNDDIMIENEECDSCII